MKPRIEIAKSKNELESCYLLRYKILRELWEQPRGSETDNFENESETWMVCFDDNLVATARTQKISESQIQLRYMAVETVWQNKGIGLGMLKEIEVWVIENHCAVKQIILNARENAVPLYLKWGAVITGQAETLFDSIHHFKMEKTI